MIYIGSTTKEYLSQRMVCHKSSYKRKHLTGKSTAFQIFDKYGIDNVEIVLLQDCKCNSKDQLLMMEKHYIETLDCVNKNKPFITEEEYQTYQKEYRDNHKHIMKLYREKEENKTKAKAYQKLYYLVYKNELKAYHKAYYLRKKAKKNI